MRAGKRRKLFDAKQGGQEPVFDEKWEWSPYVPPGVWDKKQRKCGGWEKNGFVKGKKRARDAHSPKYTGKVGVSNKMRIGVGPKRVMSLRGGVSGWVFGGVGGFGGWGVVLGVGGDRGFPKKR